MAIYDVNGNMLTAVYDVDGNSLQTAYDVAGNLIFRADNWEDEITIQKVYNATANTNYYLIRIPQTRANGEKQYPFIFAPNGSGAATMSTLTMMRTYDAFKLGMNAGFFDAFQQQTQRPFGITVQNTALVREDLTHDVNQYTLVIDSNGKLDYMDTLASGLTADDVLETGAVSACLGMVPLVIDGEPSDVESSQWTTTAEAQRQIIGQYSNGDYAIITAEGRDFDNSDGFTVAECRDLCVSLGLEFAMMLDGGGSTETVIGQNQINQIYEGTTGRIVPTYIVFNGTKYFKSYKGKKLSIIGDSISTYVGWIPSGNANYYTGSNTGVTSVDQTWWKRLIDSTEMELELNQSWSGSRVTTTRPTDPIASAGCMTRAQTLGDDPDVVITYIGINDFNNEVPLGTWDGTGAIPTATDTFKEAYAVMLNKVRARYPNAELFCATLPPDERNGDVGGEEINDAGVYLSEFNDAIKLVANAFGAKVIDFANCGITPDNLNIYMGDYTSEGRALHPNAAGHELMAKKAFVDLMTY